jgi:hypothetical protein
MQPRALAWGRAWPRWASPNLFPHLLLISPRIFHVCWFTTHVPVLACLSSICSYLQVMRVRCLMKFLLTHLISAFFLLMFGCGLQIILTTDSNNTISIWIFPNGYGPAAAPPSTSHFQLESNISERGKALSELYRKNNCSFSSTMYTDFITFLVVLCFYGSFTGGVLRSARGKTWWCASICKRKDMVGIAGPESPVIILHLSFFCCCTEILIL